MLIFIMNILVTRQGSQQKVMKRIYVNNLLFEARNNISMYNVCCVLDDY